MPEILQQALIVVTLIVGVALVAALASPNPDRYLRDEWDRVKAHTWAPGASSYEPNTLLHSRTQRVMERLAEARESMQQRGTKLLIKDKPTWRKIVTTQAPPAKVLPLRKSRGAS